VKPNLRRPQSIAFSSATWSGNTTLLEKQTRPEMAPHATGVERRRSSSANPNQKFKFPDLHPDPYADELREEVITPPSRDHTPKPLLNGLPAGLHSSERWPSRRRSEAHNWSTYANGAPGEGSRQGRQKSLGEAIRTARTRKASVSETAVEIAESLKAPVSLRLVVCIHGRYALPGTSQC
jgi:solute carrier family 35 protein E1